MKLLHKIIYGILLSLFLYTNLSAQSIRVEAPSTVGANQEFNISYTVSQAEIQSFKAPSFGDNISVLYGPALSQSSSMQMINGKVSSSSSTSYTYTLIANSQGKIVIGPASFQIGGKWVKSKEITISVGKALSQGNQAQNPNQRVGKYFLRAITSKKTVYEQEIYPVTFRLYASDGFSLSNVSPMEYEGFLSQSMLDGQQRQINTERYQNELYQVVDLEKVALFAQHSGKLSIPAYHATLQVLLRDSDNPFLSPTIDKSISSQPLTVEVKPLPTEGKPSNFSGAVGNFQISIQVDKQAKTGETLNLQLIIKGNGSLKTAQVPTLQLPETFETYPLEDKYENKFKGDEIYSERILSYPIVPRSTGKFTIPALQFSFFDPRKGSYQEVSTAPQTITISEGKQISTADNREHSENEYMGKLMPLKTEPLPSSAKAINFVGSIYYWSIYLLIALIGTVVFYWLSKRRTQRADILSFRETKAQKVARKRLKKAKEFAEKGNKEAFYNELPQALWGYMQDKFRLEQSDLSREQVKIALQERQISPELVEEWSKLIEDVEFERFAPASLARSMDELYDQSATLIMNIENKKIAR